MFFEYSTLELSLKSIMDTTSVLYKNFRVAPTKWSNRNKSSQGYKKIKEKINNFLRCVSGNDVSSMLSDVLEERLIYQIQSKYKQALVNISDSVNKKIKKKNQHNFIRPLRKAKLTKTQSKELGFKFGNFLWQSCLDESDRHLGGKPALDPAEVAKINHFMEGLSTPAANRTAIVKVYEPRPPSVPFKKKILNKTATQRQPALYCSTSITEAYLRYRALNEEEADDSDSDEIVPNKIISQVTFENYVEERFKKAKKSTDVCNFCEFSKILIKDVNKFANSYFMPISEEDVNFYKPYTSLTGLSQYLTWEEVIEKEKFKDGFDKNSDDYYYYLIDLETYKKNKEKLENIELHKNYASTQRDAYNEYRKNPRVLHNKIMIEVDYKQKIGLGNGPVQIGSEFFLKKGEKKKQVACLGFGIYFLEDKRDKSIAPNVINEDEWENYAVNHINIDVISNELRTDCFIVKQMFRHVMNIPFFKDLDQPVWVLFTDCGTKDFDFKDFYALIMTINFFNELGKQFKCAEFLHFLFVELASENKSCEVNYFVEKHGKVCLFQINLIKPSRL
jgi:hypothetical protein